MASTWQFWVAQASQLENLLRRLKVFCDNNEIMDLIKQCKSSSSVINSLNNKIKTNKVNWSDI